MSKHDVITENLKTLTRSRSFHRATEHWTVSRLVRLPRQERQACELCGTPFRVGAIVRHPRARATVVVGGTCLKTVLRQQFPKQFRPGAARKATALTIQQRYGDLVDPGTWIRWVLENAPPRLAGPAAAIQTFGTTTINGLSQLIRFHDRNRLFSRNVLFPDAIALERTLRTRIPAYLTLADARKFLKQVQTLPGVPLQEAHAEHFQRSRVLPFVQGDPELRAVWKQLSKLEQRAVSALMALDGVAQAGSELLVPSDVFAMWPPIGTAPMIVWNLRIGLGFVAADDFLDAKKANVWLWRAEKYQRTIYSLEYWRGVVGCSVAIVKRVEALAFSLMRLAVPPWAMPSHEVWH